MKGVCWLCKVLCFGSLVSKPAPDWNGTAVLDGEFKEMTLKDFRGEHFWSQILRNIMHLQFSYHREISSVFLLPIGFVSTF